MFRAPSLTVAFGSIAFVTVAGCSSLLGDFSSGDAGAPGGGDAASASVDAASSDGTTSVPVADAADAMGAAIDSGNASDGGNIADGGGTIDGGAIEAGGADAAPWTPSVLDEAGELAFWLEASSANLVISGGLVDVWNDLSQNKNNASNANGGPTVVTAAINGHNALSFGSSGLSLAMDDATSIQFGTDQVYVAAVAQVTHGTPYFFAKYSVTAGGAGSAYSTGLLFYAESLTTDAGDSLIGPVVQVDSQSGDEVDWNGTGFEDGAFHIVAMRRETSQTIVLSVDDQPLESGQTGLFDVSEQGQSAYVGSVQFGSFHPETGFEIAEVLAVHSSSGVVADADVAQVHAYLKQKYGL